MLPGPNSTALSNPYTDTQHLLYILTGVKPAVYTGKIDELRDGEHLRFSFPAKNADFHALRAKLKFFGIQHCAVLFKNLEPRKGADVLQFYITVSKDQFKKVNSYFAPGASTSLSLDDTQYAVLDLEEPLKKTIMMMLFSPLYIEGLKERAKDQYSLDGVMYYIAKLTLNTMPCFGYLKERGLEAGFSVVLEVGSSQEVSSQEREMDVNTALTPLRDTHKRRRVATVPDIDVILPEQSSNVKILPKK